MAVRIAAPFTLKSKPAGLRAACAFALVDAFGRVVLGRASSWTMNGTSYGVRIHRLAQPEATGS